ncbi:MAG TPA: hypothetical protein P5167_01000 [Bacteroidales bacterium]|nr:hypothetical protein [Bacteroidales bacterium]HRW94401.1 hypothetical protein [Bacteroidales bacterium]
MKKNIRILLLVLAAGLMTASCQDLGHTYTYYFGSRSEITFSEVTASTTPGLRELATMLSEKRNDIQKDFQFDWMVTGAGSTQEEALDNAVSEAMAGFTASVVNSFTSEMNAFRTEFDTKKQELSGLLSQETGSVNFTVRLYLTAENSVTAVYEVPLAVSESFTFACNGKNDTY